MEWLKGLFGSINKTIDKIPSDKEREIIRSEISKDLATIETQFDLELQKELTKRYEIDNAGGSWLNRNIRAIVLIVYTLLLIVLPFIPKVSEYIIDLYSTCAMLVYGFYFGGKSFEKSVELLGMIKKGA